MHDIPVPRTSLGYSALAFHFIPSTKLQEVSTLDRLEQLVTVPLARCLNEKVTVHSCAWHSQRFVNQIIEYNSVETTEAEYAAPDVSRAEELDVTEKGRGLTKTELAEFALMMTHVLWKHFVQDVAALQL